MPKALRVRRAGVRPLPAPSCGGHCELRFLQAYLDMVERSAEESSLGRRG
jgi:hypothetical protein